ncbi:MAG: hypothetical protein MJZ22_01975 [Candidatus Saccharibacteria bacterium]|nr:hypothetical protein [Candidatus Saccharibacteria bacterium]
MGQNIADTKDLDKEFTTESFISCEDDQREADLIRRVHNCGLYDEKKKKLKDWQKPAK